MQGRRNTLPLPSSLTLLRWANLVDCVIASQWPLETAESKLSTGLVLSVKYSC